MTVADSRTIRVTVTAPALPQPEGRESADTGLQDKSGALLSGQPRPGARTRYETEVGLRPVRVEGAEYLDFFGPFVHGTAGQRFLYLSQRDPGGAGWTRRCKIMLPEYAPPGAEALSVTLADVGKSRARPAAEGWQAQEPFDD